MASFLMYVLVAVAFFFMGSSGATTCESLNKEWDFHWDCTEVNTSDKVVEKLSDVFKQLMIDETQMKFRIKALEMRPTLPATQPRVNVNTTGNEDLSLTCSANVPISWNVTFSLMTPNNKTILLEDVTSSPNGTRSAVLNVPHPVPSNLTGNFNCVMRASSINDSSSFSTQWTIPVMVYVPLSIKLQKSDTATAGGKMDIMCSISGNPLPKKVTWKVKAHGEASFSNVTVEDNYNETVSIKDVEGPPVRVFKLTIKKLDVKMSGDTYKCVPQDADNLASVPPTIDIEVEMKRFVNFDISQHPKQVVAGGKVEVWCNATAEGKIVGYSWTDGDDNIMNGFNRPDGVSVLTVNESKLDKSKVVCIVSVKVDGDIKQESKEYTVQIASPQASPDNISTTSKPSPESESSEATTQPTETPKGNSVGITAVVVAVVVILVLCGAVYLVYWKRHTLREWLMEKDVVKVMKKGKKSKGYKYSKLPKDVSTSMKHLE